MILRASRAAICLLLWAAASQAAEGVIEINQASVEAAGGFPFEISESGSYRLTGNLEVDDVDTTAIWVRASYVTVDLNGFTILGPVLCDSDGACPERGDGAGVWAGPTLPGNDDDTISPGENQNQPPIPIGVEVRNGVVAGMGKYRGRRHCGGAR